MELVNTVSVADNLVVALLIVAILILAVIVGAAVIKVFTHNSDWHIGM